MKVFIKSPPPPQSFTPIVLLFYPSILMGLKEGAGVDGQKEWKWRVTA